ncbi:MAG TPA: pyruvate kinase [Thermoplasmata archaeon]|nr:pyruvate kinase [Thermoplasmata archaeon]
MAARARADSPEARTLGLLATRLERLRGSLLELEHAVDLAPFGAERDSARNLLHYLAFRRFDLRWEQTRLPHWGLSSLGRSESHVLYNLDAVLSGLDRVRGRPPARRPALAVPDPERGRRILARNARRLLGPTRPGRGVRIMVTMPAEAATDYGLVRELVEGGMDCARINCAHESPREWSRMIVHLRRAERATDRHLRIQMDLSGPKIRTGAIRPGPAVLKVRPKRDPIGRVTIPGSVWLVPSSETATSTLEGAVVTVPRSWLLRRSLRETVEFRDARRARRILRLVEHVRGRYRAEAQKTCYFTSGTRLVATLENGQEDETSIGPVARVTQRIRLRVGDQIVLTARAEPGEDARVDPDGRVRRVAHIACTAPETFRFVRRDEPIWFDDGRIGGVVRSSSPERLLVEVTHAPAAGAWLGADKGINYPDSTVDLPTFGPKDLQDLKFIVRHADLVGYSFVHRASDIALLRRELTRLGRPRMGVVLKIETRTAFEELPGILLSALRYPPNGVMIARGDLAVEVGYERLAEVQEEILWLCEAAHLPAIWATQVLEGLTKTGLPTRAEVTDAAMGVRAECVMLNKGPHVAAAVRALDGILRRMQSHQAKKTAMLRHLNVVERFFKERRAPRAG